MRRCRIIYGLGFILALTAAGCGSSGDDDNPLAKWAGSYGIFETFTTQSGDCVGEPSTTIYQGSMVVDIDGNAIDCVLDRWGSVKGEVSDNGSVIATVSLGPGETASLSGSFDDAGTFTGNLRHVNAGCTRNWQVDGSLPEAGQ